MHFCVAQILMFVNDNSHIENEIYRFKCKKTLMAFFKNGRKSDFLAFLLFSRRACELALKIKVLSGQKQAERFRNEMFRHKKSIRQDAIFG